MATQRLKGAGGAGGGGGVRKMSVEQPLWHALTGYRVLTLTYALVVFSWEFDDYTSPVAGAVYLGALTVWTLLTLRRVSSARRCTRPFLAADMAFGLAGILMSPLIDTHDKVGPTLPSIWVAGPVLAFALKGGWRWAAGASLLVGVANVIERGAVTRPTLHNVLLVCVASVAIGYVVEVARDSERTLARALQIEAATRERERLARDIHDSVLQVLAMVQRRGTALGGEAAELGRLAGEQEVALRTLVSSGVIPRQGDEGGPPDGGDGGSAAVPVRAGSEAGSAGDTAGDTVLCDVRTLLSAHSAARVSFAEPGMPVELPSGVAEELAAAVSAALDNVRRHAGGPGGQEAQAWILLEDEPDEVVVTVRDDGPGIPLGRLADAEAEGRMGVALSIRGRLRDLGGSAELVSVPGQGTEVELRVPKR
ncbi:MacS family sensor histidine kinase [Streptomyces sp. NPDC048172]|uniref:MacS family sensor histidine kinase n=1 Tax=Streptomyces sp. NPDC048172 TaxID=3365505 RepID=UPI00371DFFBC